MNKYFKILEKYEKIDFQENSDDLTNGEFKTYKSNIQQKISNDIFIKKKISNKEFIYSNFCYSENGNFLAFIDIEKLLVLFDENLKVIVRSIQLPVEIKNSIQNYIADEKRNVVKKVFSHLSFLELRIKTNNLYLSNSGEVIIISSSKLFNLNCKLTNRIILFQTEKERNMFGISFRFQRLYIVTS